MSSVSKGADVGTRIADSLFESPSDADALASARQMILRGEGKAVFDSLVSNAKHTLSSDEIVPSLMSLLEKASDSDPLVGAYLMARLYPFAGKKHDHKICNGIELWMHSLASAEVAEAIAQLARERVRPSLQTRYEGWANAIRKKAGAIA
jgi:hypothetical protein